MQIVKLQWKNMKYENIWKLYNKNPMKEKEKHVQNWFLRK